MSDDLDFTSNNNILKNLFPFENLSKKSYFHKCEESKTLLIIDPETEFDYEPHISPIMTEFKLDSVKLVHLNKVPQTIESRIPLHDFNYEESGNIGICKINIGEFPRNESLVQTNIVSLTDCSLNSDKIPVLFVGDYFNFWNFEKQSSDNISCYLNDVNTLFKGFFDEQFVFTSNTIQKDISNLIFFERLAVDKSYARQKLEQQQFQLFNLLENRMLNPLFFMKHKNLVLHITDLT